MRRVCRACVLAIAMLENLTVLTMEVLHSLWLPAGRDRRFLRVYMYARGDREEAERSNHFAEESRNYMLGRVEGSKGVGQTY